MNRHERDAQRRVDREHLRAVGEMDPVAYLRRRQAEAEAAYLASGNRRDLALVRAYARSLDGASD